MIHRRHLLALPALTLLGMPAHSADNMDPELKRRAKRAIAGGLRYLRGQQAPDGSLMKSVGITGLSLRAFLESPEGYNESDGPFITKQVEYLLSNVKPDGSISSWLQAATYNTAVAITALAATKNPKYDPIIAGARDFLLKRQNEPAEALFVRRFACNRDIPEPPWPSSRSHRRSSSERFHQAPSPRQIAEGGSVAPLHEFGLPMPSFPETRHRVSNLTVPEAPDRLRQCRACHANHPQRLSS